METRTLAALLHAWREADRRWTRASADDPDELRAAAIDVVRTWLAYQQASDAHDDALVLVADENGTYVAVGDRSLPLLGHAPQELVGRDISAITAPRSREASADLWQRFLTSGRQDGEYDLLHREGTPVRVRYVARAHFPVAGFHTSVLNPITG